MSIVVVISRNIIMLLLLIASAGVYYIIVSEMLLPVVRWVVLVPGLLIFVVALQCLHRLLEVTSNSLCCCFGRSPCGFLLRDLWAGWFILIRCWYISYPCHKCLLSGKKKRNLSVNCFENFHCLMFWVNVSILNRWKCSLHSLCIFFCSQQRENINIIVEMKLAS